MPSILDSYYTFLPPFLVGCCSLFSHQRSHLAVLRYLKSVIVENFMFLIIYILGFQNRLQPKPTPVINLVQGDYCGHKEAVN